MIGRTKAYIYIYSNSFQPLILWTLSCTRQQVVSWFIPGRRSLPYPPIFRLPPESFALWPRSWPLLRRVLAREKTNIKTPVSLGPCGWTKSISHLQRSPGMIRFPWKYQQEWFPWFQSGAGVRPSTKGVLFDWTDVPG